MVMPLPPAAAFGATVVLMGGSEKQNDDNVNAWHFASLD
jgi:hypothetical protein